MRITIDIDEPILKEVKRLQLREKRPLGRLVSDLLAHALVGRRGKAAPAPRFKWTAKPTGARVDLIDKHAVLNAMDAPAR